MSKLSLSCLLLLAACTPAETPSVTLGGDAAAEPAPQDGASRDAAPSDAAPPDANASATTLGAHCAPTYAAAGAAPCFWGNPPCTYDEGTCVCDVPPQCGGALRPPPPKGKQMPTVCTPKVPPAFRADGCPYGVPADGAACPTPAQSCKYGPCSWSATTATCTKGTWKLSRYNGPPPP